MVQGPDLFQPSKSIKTYLKKRRSAILVEREKPRPAVQLLLEDNEREGSDKGVSGHPEKPESLPFTSWRSAS